MSQTSGKITPKKIKAIGALQEYLKIEKVAKVAGVNPRTIHRWMKEPEFKTALHQAQGEAFNEIGRRLHLLSGEAIAALSDVLENPTQKGANIKRLAANSILDQLTKANEKHITEARISALEEIVNHGR
jgi:DNA-binding ferritin-like protein